MRNASLSSLPTRALAALAQCSVSAAKRRWAGADAIVLVALTLRAGERGLVTGLVAVLVMALVVFLKRRQSPATLLLALDEAVRLQPRTDQAIPKESELPAAAVLAVAGIVIEVLHMVTGVTVW